MFNEELFAGKPYEALRRHLAQILGAAVQAVEPAAAVKSCVSRRADVLRIGRRSYDLRALRRIFVVGGGKASAPMAAALEAILGGRITAGIVNVKYGHTVSLHRIQLVEAGHPLPDATGQRGAEAMLELVRTATDDDLVICVISGGGSALLPAPANAITLEDKVQVTDLLLRSGATIQEVNTVRKHLSRIKGGQLAQLAAPAHVAVLVLSDVVGNPLDVIASGPAVGDPTTFVDALTIVERYGLEQRMPVAALRYLRQGAAGEVPETPKLDDAVFARVHTITVGSNELAAAAAAAKAKALGFAPLTLTTYLEGEAREAARVIASVIYSVQAAGTPAGPPACLIAGGETTVTVRGQGKGGRCQEFALAAAMAMTGWSDVVMAAFGTDGTDGPTDAAGAMADGTTISRALSLGLSPRRALETNDAYPFFSALGDLIVTGPTNTNVNDLYVALVAKPDDRRSSMGEHRKGRASGSKLRKDDGRSWIGRDHRHR